MSLVALNGLPLVQIGTAVPSSPVNNAYPVTSAMTASAATLAAATFYGHIITSDGGSHTIDTSGSSAIGFRPSTVTLANAGSLYTIGLGTLDAANGPAARATNVSGLITMLVSKSFTGGGAPGIVTNTWNNAVPDTGTLTIANGDLIACSFQMVTRGGADTVSISATATANTGVRPSGTIFDGTATYTQSQIFPNLIITFSDGAYGMFLGGWVFSADATIAWNSGSATKEYGNYLQMPFPTKIYGLFCYNAFAGDCDLILYSDPLGTPVAEKTLSVDLNQLGTAGSRPFYGLFAAPYTTTAAQPLAAIFKPTSGTSVTAPYRSFNLAAHQVTEHLGTDGYAINRASGAFAAQNSSKDRFGIGYLVGAWDNGVSVGGGVIGS